MDSFVDEGERQWGMEVHTSDELRRCENLLAGRRGKHFAHEVPALSRCEDIDHT